MLPKMSEYVKGFDETKYVFFLLKMMNVWKKHFCHKIWNKVSNSIKKVLDSESVYNKKYLETETKSYEDKINTNFHDIGICKEGSHCICYH